jgi:hydroxylation protein CepL
MPFLSHAMATTIGDSVHQQVRALVAEAVAAGSGDVAASLGPVIPASVVCRLLGVPPADRDLLIELTNHAFGGADDAFDRMSPAAAHAELIGYLAELIAKRQRDPGDDLISALLSDGRLIQRDVLLNCDNVLVGGNETTRHAIAGCFRAVAQAPGFLGLLRADPGLVERAVEEVIRWTSPAMHALRVATADVKVAGQQVARGEAVAAWLPAANRDPRIFTDPDEFQPHRAGARHLAFGHGPHHCLGAALARLEGQVAIGSLVRRFPDLEPDGEPDWNGRLILRGMDHLPVVLRP